MKVIVGLGNPGAQYSMNRHNVGFLLIDQLRDHWKAKPFYKKYNSEIAECEVDGQKILLVKPQTYMNESGKAVGAIVSFFKLAPEDVTVIHDELDLDPGHIRIKKGGGAGGHNGLKSIDAVFGVQGNEYQRIRIGIGHPGRLGLRIDPADFVLSNFKQEDADWISQVIERSEKALTLITQNKLTEAMNLYNRKEG